MSKVLKQLEEANNTRKEYTKYLRKEHFHLGFDQKRNYLSQTKLTYTAQNSNKGEIDKEMVKLRTDLRRAHYDLGTDETKNFFLSTAQGTFQSPSNIEPISLSQTSKNELRRHHFTLGYDKSKELTEHQRNFVQNEQIDKQKNDHAIALRKHNYQFGDRTKQHYQTTYDVTLNKKFDNPIGGAALNKEELKKQVQMIRKSNLMIGNQHPDYKSETMAEYPNKGQNQARAVLINQQKNNCVLGTDKDLFKSQCQDTFKGEFVKFDDKLAKFMINDLRAQHYSIGNDKQKNISEFKSKFNPPSQDIQQNKIQNLHLQESHITTEKCIDIPKHARYESDYKQQFPLKEKIENIAVRSDKTDRSSSIVIGSQKIPNQYQTEFTGKFFDSENKVINNLNPDQIKYLKSHHYDLGKYNTEYVSQQKSAFVDRNGQFKEAKMDPKMLSDLRRNHFDYGTQYNDWRTMNEQSKLNLKGTKPGHLNEKLSKDLRSHHFHMGNDALEYSTQTKTIHNDWTKDG